MNVHGISSPEAMKLNGNVVENSNIFKANWKRVNSKQLPELEIGKEVFVRVPTASKQDDKWNRGSIVGVHNSRSYDINTEDKTIRRNRNLLKQSTSNDDGNNLREESSEDTTQNLIQEEEPSEMEESEDKGMQQSNIEGNMPRMARLERVIKTTKRYKD
ncbi:hypothetical protein AVEN_230077-1 [Araneus ventricosus]|uniref:Uncharacterized protein n=1 Tax=Araneus ventricosus TaxID=182803 RepID=A0A4Y2GYU2_ARAVE|nr:hypothetical protein AVEN_230077-1 [Araneus ventricosus]